MEISIIFNNVIIEKFYTTPHHYNSNQKFNKIKLPLYTIAKLKWKFKNSFNVQVKVIPAEQFHVISNLFIRNLRNTRQSSALYCQYNSSSSCFTPHQTSSPTIRSTLEEVLFELYRRVEYLHPLDAHVEEEAVRERWQLTTVQHHKVDNVALHALHGVLKNLWTVLKSYSKKLIQNPHK